MFVCDELTYIQVHKTGCTHIVSLLFKLFEGEKIGQHNAATPQQLASTPYVVSSIRNPWDWYVSLWAFGAQGKGDLFGYLTKRDRSNALKSFVKSPRGHYRALIDQLTKDVKTWRSVYDRSDNADSFRKWLKLINCRENRRYLGEGYSDTAITHLCGFMTYRYLYLCCRNPEQLKNPIRDFNALVEFDNTNCYVDYFIRQEALEETLCEAIEKVRPLTGKERELIFGAGKSNTSERLISTAECYDNETIALVESRERLVIEKFNYSPPE